MKSVRITSSEEVLIRLYNKLVKNTKKLLKQTNAYAFDKTDDRWGEIEIFKEEYEKTKPKNTLVDISLLPEHSIYKKIFNDFNLNLHRQIEFINEDPNNQPAYEHISINHDGEIEKILEDAEFTSKNIIAQWVYFEQILKKFENDFKELLNIDKKRINLGVDVATFNTDAEKISKGDIITKSNFLGNSAIDNDKLIEKGFNGSLFLLCRLIAYPSSEKYLDEFLQKREKDIANNKSDPLLELGIHSVEELVDTLQKLDKIGFLMKRSEEKIRIGEIDSKLIGLKLDKMTAHENLFRSAEEELKKEKVELEKGEKIPKTSIKPDGKIFLKRKPTIGKQLESLSNNETTEKSLQTSRAAKLTLPLGHSRQAIVSSRKSTLFSPIGKENITTTSRQTKITEIEKEEVEKKLEKKVEKKILKNK